MVTLLTNRDLAARFGRAGRLKAEASFDEERVFAIVTAAYARLLREKGIALPHWGATQGSRAVAFPDSVAHSTQL